jgi:hypothetical protein
VSEDPLGDEELADVAGPRWLGTPKQRRIVAALALALLLTLAGARLAAAHRNSPQARPEPVPTPRPSTATIGPSPVDVTPGRPNFRKDDPAHCPATISCTSVDSVPAGVLAAIRTYLPNAVSNSHSSVTQVHPSRLYFRQVDASAHHVTINVLVSRASRMQHPSPTEGTDELPDASIGYVRTVTRDGLVVQVQFTGLPGWTPPMAQIRALAADPRLLTLG